MNTHSNNISNVSKKLSKITGKNKQNSAIEYIETLVGRFSGVNVLEGFASNIEELNSERKDTLNFDDDDMHTGSISNSCWLVRIFSTRQMQNP